MTRPINNPTAHMAVNVTKLMLSMVSNMTRRAAPGEVRPAGGGGEEDDQRDE